MRRIAMGVIMPGTRLLGMLGRQSLVFMLAFGMVMHVAYGQWGMLGTNLIVNGAAESGQAGTTTTAVTAIPGWTRTGNTNVLGYGTTGLLDTTSPSPKDRGF